MSDDTTTENKPATATPYSFFYECAKCKAKIPASFPDNISPAKTIHKGNEYTFECPAGCPVKP
jgi:hypothetical protein